MHDELKRYVGWSDADEQALRALHAVAAPEFGRMAEVFYDITYGDLDVAVLDAGGTVLGSDGTAVANACATAPVSGAGTYFVVVVGANDVDVNRYDLRVRTFTKITTCAANGDMGAP